MSMPKARAFRCEVTPAADGLHLTIPPAIGRLAIPNQGGSPMQMYGVLVGETIQFSHTRIELMIPPPDLSEDGFVAAPDTVQ